MSSVSGVLGLGICLVGVATAIGDVACLAAEDLANARDVDDDVACNVSIMEIENEITAIDGGCSRQLMVLHDSWLRGAS